MGRWLIQVFQSCFLLAIVKFSFPISFVFLIGPYFLPLSTRIFTKLPQFYSSVQSLSHVQLCNPMNHSMQGLPIHHQLPEFTHTHVHWIGDAIQPSHPLSSPSPPALSLSQHQGLFQWVSSSHQMAIVLEFQLQHQFFQWIFMIDFLYDFLWRQHFLWRQQLVQNRWVDNLGEILVVSNWCNLTEVLGLIVSYGLINVTNYVTFFLPVFKIIVFCINKCVIESQMK